MESHAICGWDVKTGAIHGGAETAHACAGAVAGGRRASLDGEAGFRTAGGAVATVTAWPRGRGCGAATGSIGFLEECSVTLFHEGFAIALVGGYGAGAPADGTGVIEGRHALEFAEDGVLVGKEVADETDSVFLFHCEGGLGAGAEDAARESGGEGRDVFLIGGCQVNQAREVVHAGVKSRNVTESQLGKGLLQNGYTRGFG